MLTTPPLSPLSQPVDASGELQRDRWMARVELQPLDVQWREAVSINLVWYLALEKDTDQSARILQGIADKREDVQLEIGSGNGEVFHLTAHTRSAEWELHRACADAERLPACAECRHWC
jgi:hypothetical protein